MKKQLRKILFFICNAFSKSKSNGALVLMYHSVSFSPAFFVVKPKEFEKQIKFLKQSGLLCINFSELMRKIYAKESLLNTVCVTFDDGYADNYEIALPILKKYGIPASIFVSTGFIGKMKTTSQGEELAIMTETMINDLSVTGLVECLPHGHLHQHLETLNPSEVKTDVLESQMILDRLTGKTIPGFAYPFGSYSEKTVEVLSSLGFKGALTVEEGVVTPDSKPFELPRMTMSREVSFTEFKCKITKATTYLSVARIISGKF